MMYGPAREQPKPFMFRTNMTDPAKVLGWLGPCREIFLMIIIIITFLLRDNVIIYSQALCDPSD